MAHKHLQQSFTGGELSPAMYGRLDDQKYQQGVATCRNFVVLPQGPVRNRSGFAYVGSAKYADKPTILLPFVFSSDDTMLLEFGDKYIRVITHGGYVSSASGATTPLEITTPYAAEDLKDIHFAQSGDVMTLVHPNYAPRELRRYGVRDWRLVQINFGAPLAAPTGLSGSYVCNDANAKDAEKTTYKIRYKVTALRTTDEGNKESTASAVCEVTGNLYLSSSRITLTWNAVAGAERYRVYKTYSGVYGYVGEVETTSFVDNNIANDPNITPPRYDDPFNQAGGITSVTVTNGGSGYKTFDGAVTLKSYGAVATSASTANSLKALTMPMAELKKLNYLPASSTNLSAKKSWTVSSSSGYPGDQEAINWAKSFMELVDEAGNGSGATFEPEFEITYGKSTDQDTNETTYSKTATLTGFRVTGTGNGYKKATARVYVVPFPLVTSVIRYEYALTTFTGSDVTCEVVDSTGSGAELAPVITNGRVASVTVRAGGSGYSSPTIRFISTGSGSGAAATASVGQAGDYPGAVSYFEQRRIFAGTASRPLFVWMTRPGTESDMSYTLPSQKDNRIKFRVAALQASRIRHIVPLSSLILMTTSAEFRVTTANDDTLTPSSVGVKPQSYVGASNVSPVIVNSSIVYASERGGHVWELGYNWQASGFVTGDMCLRAAHLFDGKTVVSMTQSKAPTSIIWCVSSDGTLLGCTYVPEQSVGAWHRHDTKNGAFESVACVSEGDEDILYAVIRRTINGQTVRYIERMHEREALSLEESFFVDAGIEDVYKTPQNFVDNLGHLEGCEVAILADGKVMPRTVVTNGRVTFPDKATRVIVGLPIESDLQTLPVALQTQDGGFAQGSMKNVVREYVRVYRSSGVKVGASFDELYEAAPRRFESYGTPPQLKSDNIEVMSGASWGDSGAVCIRQDEPLPLMICGLTAEIAL